MKIFAIVENLRCKNKFVVPAVAAIFAAFMAFGYIDQREKSLMHWSEKIDVVLASSDIQDGEMISL